MLAKLTMPQRKRRVKCDEAWPVCVRCLSTGRVCDGYGVWGGGGNAYGSSERVAPSSSLSSRSSGCHAQLPHSLPPSLSPIPALGGPNESLAFEYFWHRTTIKLIGIFESFFWKTLVLQASSSEPTVLHAVTAAGAAHRRQENLALKEYNKAIVHLGRNLRGQDKQTLRLALMACLIFICIELLRGEFKAGHAHLQNGLQLLSEHLRHEERPGSTPKGHPPTLKSPEDSIDNHLVEAFTPLNMQSALFGMGHSFLVQLDEDMARAMPLKFKTTREARSHLQKMINAIDCLSAEANEQFLGQGRHSYKVLLRRENIEFALARWKRAFDSSYESLVAVDALSSIASRVLAGYHAFTTLRAATSLRGADEMVFDAYLPAFVAIIDHVMDIWHHSSQYIAQSIVAAGVNHTSFTMDLGFIPLLYFTALKCRAPSLRRSAISLLVSTSHREGIWDGYLVARIADRVMELEEGALGSDVQHHTDSRPSLPLSARFNDVRILPLTEGSGNKAKLVLRRYKLDRGVYLWESETEEVDISNEGPPPDYPLWRGRESTSEIGLSGCPGNIYRYPSAALDGSVEAIVRQHQEA